MAQAEKTISEAMEGVDRDSMRQAQQILEIVFNNLK